MARVRVGTWNLLGGRRWKDEASAETTAAREASEETGGALSEELTTGLLRGERTRALWLPDSRYAVFITPISAAPTRARDGGGAADVYREVCGAPGGEVIRIAKGDDVDALQWVPWEAVRRACPSRRRRGLYRAPVPLNEREMLHPFLVATVANGLIGAHLRREAEALGAPASEV